MGKIITVGTHKVDVDILLELDDYLDQFPNYRIRDDKLQSCSPFREDSHPSFAVNLENGSWIDSGAVGEYHKGHFTVLLAYLREESVEDTVEYLLDYYSVDRQEVSALKLDMGWLTDKPTLNFIAEQEVQQYAFRHPYLSRRGITEEVQRQFRVGYCKKSKAVVMPHTDKHGNIVNLKFRSVSSKKFWYSGGQPVKNHLYGLFQCLQSNATTVWIVESETDCMRLWSEGIPAIALGTAHMSKRQKQLLISSPIKEIIVATDNDPAGRACAEQIISEITGILSVILLGFPEGVKDICDMDSEQILGAELKREYLFN